MTVDHDRLRAEAAIYERYGEFKKLVMRLINENFEHQQNILSSYGSAEKIYRSLQLGLAALGIDGLAMRGEGAEAFWYCCFSGKYWKIREIIRQQINAIGTSTHQGIRHHGINVDGRSVNLIIVPVNGDSILVINPHRRTNMNEALATAWFPVAATYRELIRQYRRNFEKWNCGADVKRWRIAEEGIGSDRSGGDSGRANGALETITISLDLRKSTFAMEQAKDNAKFASWMNGLIAELTGHAKSRGAIFDKFTGDGVIVHFPVNPPWGEEEDRNVTLTKALRCAADLVGIVDKHLPDLRMNLHNNSGKFGAGVGMAMADAQWGMDANGQFMVVGKGVVGACRAADDAVAGRIRLVNSAYQPIAAIPDVKRGCFRLKSFKTKEFSKELDVSVWEVKASEVDGILPH